MSRLLIMTALVLACLTPGLGARDIEFNVDFFCGWDGYYRPMEWTPVEIGIGSVKEPFSGVFSMTARQDGLNHLHVLHSFVLTPERPLSVPLVSKFAFPADQCRLAIRDEKGRTRWQQTINTWDSLTGNRMLRAIQEQDLLLGLLGQAQFGLLRLPQETVCLSDRGPGKVCLGSKVARAAPWDWTGYASLDLLVLCDVDWSLMQPQQCKAIREWISNGGNALVILGQHPLPKDNPLAQFLPFGIGEPKQTEIPSEILADWGLDASKTQVVTSWVLSPKPGAVVDETLRPSDAGGLYGAGYAGFGRVAVLGFSPAQLGEGQAGRSAAFWTRQIAACCVLQASSPRSGGMTRSPTRNSTFGNSTLTTRRQIVLTEQAPQASGNRGYNPNPNYYQISIAQRASNQVMEFLYQLEQMRPLSIWWIVLTLMALAVLLGPVDYFVLKWLDKLPYTWLTSAGWIVIFTVGAYFGVQWLRSGDMEVRAVSVLDGIADSNSVPSAPKSTSGSSCAWATSYTSLFAPRSGDYRLGRLTPNQWWSGIAPTREEMWGYQHDAGMQQIHCLQVDGGNLPVSLPINMWTVQPLLSEWPLERLPLAATVERRSGGATVEITNTSDNAIGRGYVLFGDACADLGPVPAHATRQFDVRTRPFRPWQSGNEFLAASRTRRYGPVPLEGDVPCYPGGLGAPAERAFLAQGCLSRTIAMHTCLDRGAALVCVMFDNAPLPINVKDRVYGVNHIQVARLLVLPKKVKEEK
jgi:hypothetical protein